MERAIMCPQCNAPLTPHQFARSIVCLYCGATVRLDDTSVDAEKFHDAYRVWNSLNVFQVPSWISIGDQYWQLDQCISHGEHADVYFGRRARQPVELVIIKIFRESQFASTRNNEWDALNRLQQSEAAGAENFTRLIPIPIIHGTITSGSNAGSTVSIFRWISGFRHDFEDVIRVYPQGIPPRASIWIWRRILEVLSFIHASGMAHGAVLPAHLLIQQNDHGVRLIGFSCAGNLGEKFNINSPAYQKLYPNSISSVPILSSQLDLIMSARVIASILGGDAAIVLPAAVPPELAAMVKRIALLNPASSAGLDAWDLREELGVLSSKVFGPPKFFPVEMPA